MRVFSVKEEFLYKNLIDRISIVPRTNGYIIDILSSDLPKDKYNTDEVLKAIADIHDKCSEIVDQMLRDGISIDEINIKELSETIFEKIKNEQ